MSNTLNLEIYKGTNANWRLTATDASSNALNLSGFTLSGSLYCNYGSTGILLDLNPQFYSAESGIIDILLSGYVTSTLPVTQAVYGVYAFQGSGIGYNFLRGYMNIFP